MTLVRWMLLVALLTGGLVGCGEPKTVIPTGEFTEEQKKAIKAEDDKIADAKSDFVSFARHLTHHLVSSIPSCTA